MTPEVPALRQYYPKMSEWKTTFHDNWHLYIEYHRLCGTLRDIDVIRDTTMRDVFRQEIEKRQWEILKIIKIN